MTEQQNTPELRFPEFDNNWLKKRLKDISDINPKSKQNIPKQFNYIDLESVKKGKIINISNISKDKAPSRAQRIAQKQDIFFQTVRPYQQNNFIYNFDIDDVVVSTGYAQIRTNNHKYYIFTLLHTYRFLVNVLLNCTGSNYPAINSTDLSNIEVYLTENKLEQEKIGVFFSKLDRQIELEEEKLELLEQQKNGYMQKIFSKELRFKDENGNVYPNWEIQKLGQIAMINTGKSKISNEIDGEFFNLGSTGIIGKSNHFDYEGSFLLTARVGHYAGSLYTFKGKANITDNTIFMQTNLSLEFIKELLNNYNLKRLAFGSGQPLIKSSELKNLKFNIPCVDEIEKIGKLFNKLNQTIELHTSKLELLKQRKKGLLQKMFI